MNFSSDRPSSLDLSGRIYRSLLNFGDPKDLLIEESYQRVMEEDSKKARERLSYFEQIQDVLEGENEFPEYSSSFFNFEEDEYNTLKEEFDQYSRDTAATYSAIEAIVNDMRNPLNSGQFVFKRIFGHFSHVQEQLGAQLSYKYFFNGNPDNQESEDPFGISSTVQNYFKQGVLRSYRRYSAIQQRLDQDFEFAKNLQSSTDTYVNRPGILPIMDLIRSSSTAIDIDIFQLQNESVLDLLVAQKIKNPEMRIRVKLAGLDEGRIDRVAADILAPNSYVSGVLEALNTYMINKGYYQADDDDRRIEILRARSRNHPKLIIGDKEAIIGSMNLTAPLGNNPLKAGSNFEVIRRVRDEKANLPNNVQEKIQQNEELSVSEYSNLSSTQQDQYLNTYLYHQLKQVMEYNITRFRQEDDDLPFEYSQFRSTTGAFGTGTALVGGPSDIYELFQRSLELLNLNKEGQAQYGLIMNIDQPLILQGALGAQGEGGYQQGEFGLFSKGERQALSPAMAIFQRQSLELLEAIGKGYAHIVVDPRNYRSKVLEPFRAFVDPLLKSDLPAYENRLELLVAAKASGSSYRERLNNLTQFMKKRMAGEPEVRARDIATQMLALTSPNIQMAAHPKAHAKGFSLFEIKDKEAEHLINSSGSGNFTPGSLLPTLKALHTEDPSLTETDYQRMREASSNELSLLGYKDTKLEGIYGEESPILANAMAKEMGKHLEKTFDQLTYAGRFTDGLTNLNEGGPAKFQSTDGRWERGVDIARTAQLKDRIQSMFDETGLSEQGASVELLRNNQSDATRLIVNLDINQMAQTSGVMARKYEISVLRGGQVYIANKGLVVSSAIFTNSSNMPFRDFFGEDLQAGETRKLSSEDVALSIFSTMSLEALNLGLLELPKVFGATADKKNIYLNYLTEVLGIKGDPTTDTSNSSSVYKRILDRFSTEKSRLKTLSVLSETLFKDSFIGTPDPSYRQELVDILVRQGIKDKDRLQQVLKLMGRLEDSQPGKSLISQRVYSSQYSFSYELNERMQALEADIFKPFLTYTQSHTYSASTETTRKIRLGLGRNPALRKAIGEVNREEGPWKIARYAAMALPFSGITENIEEAFISSVAGGVTEINKDRMLSTFFGTRSQSYEEVKSLDLIEILSVGSRINKETIEEYLTQSRFSEEDKQEILEQFTTRLGANQFITTFGGESKFSQIGQRLKNVGGSRALMEMSYSAQYLMEQTGKGEVEPQKLEEKLAQDPFGFLLTLGEGNRKKSIALLKFTFGNENLNSLLNEVASLLDSERPETKSISQSLSPPPGSNLSKEQLSKSFAAPVLRAGSLIKRIDSLINGYSSFGLSKTEYQEYSDNLVMFRSTIARAGLSLIGIQKSPEAQSQDAKLEEFLASTESAIDKVEKALGNLRRLNNLIDIDTIKDIPSLQQAYLKGMRQALTAYGVDPSLAERIVDEELSIAAIAGGRVGSVIPSDVREVYQEERQSLSNLLGKDDSFFNYGVGQELLRARLAYRETETQGPRGALGSRRRKPGFSLLQVGGFYYDANFFFNPNYDEGIRYFFSDRVQKSVMSSNISLEGLTFDVKAGDIIRPIPGDETQFGVYRGGKQIDTVTDRSQVKVIEGALDSFNLQGVQGKAEVTRKASTPLGREAMELVVNTVETTSALKAAVKVEVSLIRSTLRTAGAREDTNLGLIKGVGIPSSAYAEYAAQQMKLESNQIFGIFTESSMKSYIYGHGITIARDEELREGFIETIRKNPEKAAAAIAYMFSKKGPYEQQDVIESKYLEKALRGDYGEFFQKEAIAQSLLGEGSPLKEAYERVQTPSLGIGLFKEETLMGLLDSTQNSQEAAAARLIQDINALMDQVSGTPATVGAGPEGLKGREADIILTAMDFFMQLSEDKTTILPPGLSIQPEAIRTLALGAGYSTSEIEKRLSGQDESFTAEVLDLTRTVPLKFYFTPSPGQMKTPFSSQSQSKAEIQARLTPFVTTRDSFTSRNTAVSNIRRVLAAGLLMTPEKDRLPLTIKETKNVSVAGFADDKQRDSLKKILSLQEAYRTLSGIPSSTEADLKSATERMKKLGEFESSFYTNTKKSAYNIEHLRNTLSGDTILELVDKEYFQTQIEKFKEGEPAQEEFIRGLFFKRAEEISLELRKKALPFAQYSEAQIDVDQSQDFINRLKTQGIKTFGLNLPELVEMGSAKDMRIKGRFTIKSEESTIGVILSGEYLSTLNSAAHQDFVSPILTTQAKLHEHLAEGSLVKDVLRRVLVNARTKKGEAPFLKLTIEEFKAYTEFRNLLSKTTEQLTESLSESFLKQILGAQTSSGFVGTGVGSLALDPFEAHIPLSARDRAYRPEKARERELNRVLGTLELLVETEARLNAPQDLTGTTTTLGALDFFNDEPISIPAETLDTGDLKPDIDLLKLKARALLEGISPKAKRAFKTDMEEKHIEENRAIASKAKQADEYIYELMLRNKRGESVSIAEPSNLDLSVGSYTRDEPIPKIEVNDLEKKAKPSNLDLFVGSYIRDEPIPKIEVNDLEKKIEDFIKTFEQVDQERSKFLKSSSERLYRSQIMELKGYLDQLKQGSTSNQQDLIALRVQKLIAESGDEGIARILRSAPTGSLEIPSSIFYQTSLEEINQRFERVSEFDLEYKTKLDPEASSTLTMVPLLSAITTMLGDFDGDQMIGYFVKFSDKVLRKVELERKIKEINDEINGLNTDSDQYQSNLSSLRSSLSSNRQKLDAVEIEIGQLKSNLNQEHIENAVISHVSAYLGIDKSYFLAKDDNYFFKLLDDEEKENVREQDRYREKGIRTEKASIQEVVSLLEQGRGLIASLEDLKSLEDKLTQIIEKEDYNQFEPEQKQAIETYIEDEKGKNTPSRTIARKLAKARKGGEFSKKIAGLAKGHLQDEQTLMLGLTSIGQAGSVILGKTYNILYDSLLVDAPVLAIKKGLETSKEQFIDALMDDLKIKREEATSQYDQLLKKLTEGYESTRALKAFTMGIEQMMRDSIKPKKNKAFLEDLKKLSEDYNNATDPEDKKHIIENITKNLGSGPKGLLALINLHDFLGDNPMRVNDKKKLLDSLLGADSIRELSAFLGKTDVTSVDDIPSEELDSYLGYLLSRDALNTSAGFMYERTLGINSINLLGLGTLFSGPEKLKKSIKQRFGDDKALSQLVEIPDEGNINISNIKDLGLRRFIDFYDDESKKDGEASRGELIEENGELTKKGHKALEYWLGRYKDSVNLFGVNGELVPRLKAVKLFKDKILRDIQQLSPIDEDILDIQLTNIYKTLATRGQGSIPSVVKQLSKFTQLLVPNPYDSTLDQLITFLDRQEEGSIYSSEEVRKGSKGITTLLNTIKEQLEASEGDETNSTTSRVAHLFDSILGLTHSGEVLATLRTLQKEKKPRSEGDDKDYLISKPAPGLPEGDSIIESLEKFVNDTNSGRLNFDRSTGLESDISNTLSRFSSENLEIGLESMLIPALILGHAIASGYDPEATTGEVISQQVVGGTLVSSLYMTSFFSQAESSGNRTKFAAKSTIFGSAAKVRLTMAQEEENGGSDLIGGVIKTAAMEASFALTSSLVSSLIESPLKQSRRISRTLDIDALEGPKTIASFVVSSLFSAAAGLMAQNAVKQIIIPSALELIGSIVGNLAQTIGQQRTQTARYETEPVEMETEVDFPVYELTAFTDYVQADLVAEHILTLSSTEMSGEAMEEAIFVRDAEDFEVV